MPPSSPADIEALRAALRQAQKLGAVGQLAGGVAHDLNNVLTIIQSFGELVQLDLPADAPSFEYMQHILDAAERARKMTRELLAFSRQDPADPRVVTLNEITEKTLGMVRGIITENIDMRFTPCDGAWPVKVDPTQFEQVVLNLAVNARDAMGEGGALRFETHNVVLDGGYARAHGVQLDSGDYAMLAVSDTGDGISEGDQHHVFEPFFTTKDARNGTGLGLSTCYGIIKQAGGFIWVYSEVGLGTTFKVYLPRSRDRPVPVQEPRAPLQTLRGTETLLVVEDDDQVRKLFARTLRDLGYHVLSACHGIEALSVLEAFDGEIDLLISDVVMPQMGGPELAASLRCIHPGVRVLFVSGYTGKALAQHGVLDPTASVLEKPCTPQALGHRIRTILDATAGQDSSTPG